MKTFKKYFEVALCFLAIALTSCTLLFVPKTSKFAHALNTAIGNYKEKIEALNLPKKVDASKGFKINLPTTEITGARTIVKVTLKGETRYYIVGQEDKDYYCTKAFGDYKKFGLIDADTFDGLTDDEKKNFTEVDKDSFTFTEDTTNGDYINVNFLTSDTYNVAFIVETDSKEYITNQYSVIVENANYTINIDNLMLPSKVKKGDEVTLPDAEVTDAEGNTFLALIKVQRGGHDIELSSNKFTATQEGIYTVQYYYNLGNKPVSKIFEINSVSEENYVQATKLDVSSTSLEKAELGTTQKLPKLSVSYKDGKKEDNVGYKITKIRIEKLDNPDIYYEIVDADIIKKGEFDFNVENFEGVDKYEDMVGKYKIIYTIDTYEVKDFEYAITTTDIKVSKNPTLTLTYDYNVSLEDDYRSTSDAEDLKDYVKTYENELKKAYDYNAFVAPAVYVTDQVSTLKDMYVIRTLVSTTNSSKIYYIDNLKYTDGEIVKVTKTSDKDAFNYAMEDGETGNFSVAQEFKFEDGKNLEGDYKLVYHAYSKVVPNSKGAREGKYESTSFKLTTDKIESEKNHKVEIKKILNGSKKLNTDIFEIEVSATADVDTKLVNGLFYYTSFESKSGSEESKLRKYLIEAQSETNVGNKTMSSLDNSQLCTFMEGKGFIGFTKVDLTNNKATIDLTDDAFSGKTEIHFVAVSISNYASENVQDATTFSLVTDVKTINIDNVTTDNIAPTISIKNLDSTLVVSGEVVDNKQVNLRTYNSGVDNATIVTLPSVDISDDHSINQVSVNYYTENDHMLRPLNYSIKNNVLSGGKLTLTQSGMHYVSYTVTDSNGNTSVMFFSFNVVDNTRPNISVTAVNAEGGDLSFVDGSLSVEFGSQVTLSADLFQNAVNKTNDANASIDFAVQGEKGIGRIILDGSKNNYTFVAENEGTFTIVVSGKIGELIADESKIKIVVSKPAFAWDKGTEFNIPTAAQIDTPFSLNFDKVKTNDVDAEIKVVVKLGSKEIAVLNNGADKVFTPTEKGVYSVQYIANNGVTEIKSETIKVYVGDTFAPLIDISGDAEAKLSKDVVYNNSDLEYTISIDKDERKVKLTLVDTSNNSKLLDNYDLGLVLRDQKTYDEEPQEITNWNKLNIKVVGADTTDNEKYIIDSTGTYTLRISIKDSNDLETIKEISFKVVNKADVTNEEDSVLAIVLIVLSLVVLAGVILFFALTGKKDGTSKKSSKKTKKDKKSKKETGSQEKTEVETKTEEVEAETEAKDEKVEEVVEDKTEEVEVKENDNTTEVIENETAETLENSDTENNEENVVEEKPETDKVEENSKSEDVSENLDTEKEENSQKETDGNDTNSSNDNE